MLELMRKSKAKQAKYNQKGFTLVELIVVVAIIGILAAIGIARMGGFGDSARARGVESEHRMLISAIQMWQSQQDDVDSWPAKLSDLDSYVTGGTMKTGGAEGDALADKKGGGVAHVLTGGQTAGTLDGKLVSTYEAAEGNQWTYGQDGTKTKTAKP